MTEIIQKNAIIIGLMSGTSLDGLDIVACTFHDTKPIGFKIVHAETYKYSDAWKMKLEGAFDLPAEALVRLDLEYGKFLGSKVKEFCEKYSIKAELISSHGHTVFHRPDLGYTLQIGHAGALSLEAGCSVVADFRSADVAIGGQGAPLVPIGDELLFGNFSACLNLGGFANVSHRQKTKRIAFDICPLNMALNEWSEKLGYAYDEGGKLAASGKCIYELYEALLSLSFFREKGPKSLGREWYLNEFRPLLMQGNLTEKDVLRTVVEVQAELISKAIPEEVKDVLVTGGGGHNAFLMQKLEEKRPGIWNLPQAEIVDFKEALVFAFLGWLRIQGRVNCLSSVTGAPIDHSSGVVYPYNNLDN